MEGEGRARILSDSRLFACSVRPTGQAVPTAGGYQVLHDLLEPCAVKVARTVLGGGRPVTVVGLMVPHAVRLLLGPDHRTLLPMSMILGGTFMVLADLAARTARLCGATVHHCSPYQKDIPATAEVLESVHRFAPTLLWLCHPTNSTGHAWRVGDLRKLAERCQEHEALLVLDLAYLNFLERLTHHLPLPLLHNAVQLYSLTKSFRLPGVRAGYALASPEVVNALERSAPPWQMSVHAQAATGWAFSDAGRTFLRRTLPELGEVRRDFQAKLRTLGLQVRDTSANYFLVEVGDAVIFKQAALRAGFRVRDCASFGLPTQVRLAAQQPRENQTFLAWLESGWLPEGG